MSNRILRESERALKTGIPTSTWYELMEKDLAPNPVPLGPRSVGWLESELDEWIAARIAERPESNLRRIEKRAAKREAHTAT